MQMLFLPILRSRSAILFFADPHLNVPPRPGTVAAAVDVSPTTPVDCLGDGDEGCKLLDGFAIVVQLSLATTALLVLVYKRYRERPQRPVPIWALDVSKQFVGAGVIHFLNLAVSYLVGRPMDGPKTNLCVWYFLNVLVDTTVGVGILWFWLHAIQYVLERYVHVQYIRSGNYGPGPLLRRRAWPWLKQTMVFVTSEGLMKLCVLMLFRLFPVLFELGSWALGWTRGNYRYQVVFVMFIFPLIMNAIQFWIVDTIVKVNPALVPSDNKHNNNEDDHHPASHPPDPSFVIVPVPEDEQTPLLQASH